MTAIVVKVDPELKAALAEAAKRDDRSVSNFARRVLAEAVR